MKTHQPGNVATFAHLSEWLRDGLIRIVEVMGTDNIWHQELIRLTDAQSIKDGLSPFFFAIFIN